MNDHLETPEEPELLDRGVIWTTQVLPQLVGVTHAVVKVICDIDQTWRRMEMRREGTAQDGDEIHELEADFPQSSVRMI